MSMSGVGLGTPVAAMRQAGIRPLLLGAILSACLICGGAMINGFAGRWL
jgi:uncharacterized membrane protein YadS